MVEGGGKFCSRWRRGGKLWRGICRGKSRGRGGQRRGCVLCGVSLTWLEGSLTRAVCCKGQWCSSRVVGVGREQRSTELGADGELAKQTPARAVTFWYSTQLAARAAGRHEQLEAALDNLDKACKSKLVWGVGRGSAGCVTGDITPPCRLSEATPYCAQY